MIAPNGGGHRLARIGAWPGLLAMLVAVSSSVSASDRTVAPAQAAQSPSTIQSPPPAGIPEKTSLKVGLAVHGTGSLPMYVAADHTFREEGLQVEIMAFTGGATVSQALASDSVDIALASPNGLINMIAAGQPVKAFYAGFHQVLYAWLARPETPSWSALRGRGVAVNNYGDITDSLTRYVLKKHGLEPGRDVQIHQVGGSPNAFQALKAGRVHAALLSIPVKWRAEEAGFVRIGTQATEVAEEWPNNVLFAKERTLNEYPNTIRRFLRAHVKAIRLAKRERESTVQTMMRALKYDRPTAERAYTEVVPGFHERGLLPARWMPVFWEITVAAGDVKEAWPESRFLDRRFIDTFDTWAPR